MHPYKQDSHYKPQDSYKAPDNYFQQPYEADGYYAEAEHDNTCDEGHGGERCQLCPAGELRGLCILNWAHLIALPPDATTTADAPQLGPTVSSHCDATSQVNTSWTRVCTAFTHYGLVLFATCGTH